MQLETEVPLEHQPIGPRRYWTNRAEVMPTIEQWKAAHEGNGCTVEQQQTHGFGINDYNTIQQLLVFGLQDYGRRWRLGKQWQETASLWLSDLKTIQRLLQEQGGQRRLTHEGLLELHSLLSALEYEDEHYGSQASVPLQEELRCWLQQFNSQRWVGIASLQQVQSVFEAILENYQWRWEAGKEWIEKARAWVEIIKVLGKAQGDRARKRCALENAVLLNSEGIKELQALFNGLHENPLLSGQVKNHAAQWSQAQRTMLDGWLVKR